MRTLAQAILACPRQGRLHANGRLLSLRIIARQRALHVTCIFCLWLNYCSPYEGCNMRPDRPTRKRKASKATSCVRRASSSSNDSNPTYQDAAGALMTLTWLLLGFNYRVLREHSSLTFFRTREGNGRQRVAVPDDFFSIPTLFPSCLAVCAVVETRRCGCSARPVSMLDGLNSAIPESGRYSRDGGWSVLVTYVVSHKPSLRCKAISKAETLVPWKISLAIGGGGFPWSFSLHANDPRPK
jgi:hypothetical protein